MAHSHPRILAATLVAVVLAACGAPTADGPDTASVGTPTDLAPAPAPQTDQPSADPQPDEEGTATPTPTPIPAPTEAGPPPPLTVELVLDDLVAPLQVLSLEGATLIVQQDGRVLELVEDGVFREWLDLSDRVAFGGEQGLLGIDVLHDGAHLVVHYSQAGSGATRLATLPLVDGRPDVDGLVVVLEVDQPASNHNGGTVIAAPDGTVLLGLGDGGGAGDRFDNGQDPATLLGTVLRIDLSDPTVAAVPADNPWVDGGEGNPLVWLHGLRNPFRMAIGDGQLYIADVGQDAVEELTVVPLDPVSRNLGWPVVEGDRCFADSNCDPAAFEPADVVWTHEETGACSAITGMVYAGTAITGLAGHALYGDLCAGFLRTARAEGGVVVDGYDLGIRAGGLLSIGADADGEPLLTFRDGRVVRLVPVR